MGHSFYRIFHFSFVLSYKFQKKICFSTANVFLVPSIVPASVQGGISRNGMLQNRVLYRKLKFNEIQIYPQIHTHICTYTHILLLLLLAQFLSTVPIPDTSMAVSWASFHCMWFLSRDNSVGVWNCAPGMWRRLQIELHMNTQPSSKVVWQQASSLSICTYRERGSSFIMSWFDKSIYSFLMP